MQHRFGKFQSLTVRGYKSIRALDALDLRDVNIIIGANGSGKSNFISIFDLVSRANDIDIKEYIKKKGGPQRLFHFGPKFTDHICIQLASDSKKYGVEISSHDDGGMNIIQYFEDRNESLSSRETEIFYDGGLVSTSIPSSLSRDIQSWRTYHFHDTSTHSPLRSDSTLAEPERLSADGGNLPAFLYYMEQRHPDRYQMLRTALRPIMPFLGDFVLGPYPLNPNLTRLRWRHAGRDEVFDVSDLSDGSLRFIALAALLLQPDPPSTLILDEPELGLHPAAIAHLASLMQQVAPEVQIIAATQSPTFASHFAWKDFIISERKGDETSFRRLTEDEVAPWMDEFSMGEIWEKNLIGGRP